MFMTFIIEATYSGDLSIAQLKFLMSKLDVRIT